MSLEIVGSQVEQIESKILSTQTATFIKILKCAIGSGLLSLPYQFRLIGFVGGALLIIGVGILNFYSWSLMIITLQNQSTLLKKDNTSSLPEYLAMRFGQRSYQCVLCQVATIVLIFGACVSFIIFMNSVILEIIRSQNKEHFFIPYLIILFLIIYLVSFKKSLESFKIVTGIATIFSLAVIIFVIIFCIFYVDTNTITSRQVMNLDKFPIVFGLVLYAYDINGIITEIRSEMKEPQNFLQTLGIAMIVEAIFYQLIGVLGYLSFGNSTSQIITVDVDHVISNPSFRIVFLIFIFLYGLSLISSIFLNNIPALKGVYSLVSGFLQINLDIPIYQYLINAIYVFLLIVDIYSSINIQQIIPVLLPKFTLILSLLGCICSVTLGFVFPFIIHYNYFRDVLTKKRICLNVMVLLIGVFGGIMGVVLNIDPNSLN